MAVSFDSLGYAHHLREHRVPQEQAEAHADAARMLIMQELVTKKRPVMPVDTLQQSIDAMSLRLTIGWGLMLAVGFAILGAVLKLT